MDLATRKVLTRVSARGQGRLYLHAGANGRVYAGTSAVLEGQILALATSATGIDLERPLGRATSDGKRLLRGGWFVTPGGRHLLTGNGYVFGAPAG
jgi:hypothetical protein